MGKKIVWVSNAPWAPTGYGDQTALTALRLKQEGYDVALVAFYGLEGALGTWEGMTVYPTDHTRLAKHFLRDYVNHHADGDPLDDVLVITLMDIWTMTDPRWGGIARTEGLRMASWVPIDHNPIPPKVMNAIETVGTYPIAMSRFGQEMLTEVGLDSSYVPHAVDTSIFKPQRGDKSLILKGIPDDAFVVGMVANNQGSGPPRKAFPQVFQAFAEFHSRHEDTFLYLHCDVFGLNEGINLLGLAHACGIPNDAIGAVDQFKYHIGAITPALMARVYSTFDVLASPSYGEGFGICSIQSQACGTPVIVTDWTAMPELVRAGWKVQGDRWYNNTSGSYYMCPSVYEIIDALEKAYEARNDMELRETATKGMQEYDVEHVFQNHWLPTLEKIESLRVKPNRAMRRQKVKA